MDGQCAPGKGRNSRRTGDGDCSGFAAAAGTDAIAAANTNRYEVSSTSNFHICFRTAICTANACASAFTYCSDFSSGDRDTSSLSRHTCTNSSSP